MLLSTKVLGTDTVRQLEERITTPLLVIGRDRFHRQDLATIGCFNFIAAQRLSSVLQQLGVKDTQDLFTNFPPTALVVPSIGAIALAVLGAAFEARGIGGNQPLEAWILKHRGSIDSRKDIVTFHTLKHKEAQREIGEARAKKARAHRKHTRRNQAHQLRVDRFTSRQQKVIA